MSLSPVDTRQCSATSPALYGCSHVRKFSRVDSVRQGVALLIPSVALCYVTISFGPPLALCVAPLASVALSFCPLVSPQIPVF